MPVTLGAGQNSRRLSPVLKKGEWGRDVEGVQFERSVGREPRAPEQRGGDENKWVHKRYHGTVDPLRTGWDRTGG